MRAGEEFPRKKGEWNCVMLYATLTQKQLEGKGRELGGRLAGWLAGGPSAAPRMEDTLVPGRVANSSVQLLLQHKC